MQRLLFISYLTFSVLFFTCKDTNSTSNSQDTVSTDSLKIDKKTPKPQKESVTIYAWVDKLRLRAEPKTESEIVKELSEGEELAFDGLKTDFTKKVNLRGTVYDEPWLNVKTTDGKEGWVYGGGVKFYKPSVDESPSPYDECYALRESGKHEDYSLCKKRTQRKQIQKISRNYKALNDGFELFTMSGTSVKFIDQNDPSSEYKESYAYRYYIPEMGFFVIEKENHESREYLLMNDKTGSQTSIEGYPKPSADHTHLAAIYDGSEGMPPNGIEVWGFGDDGFAKRYEKEVEKYYLRNLIWIDNNTLEYTLKPTEQYPDLGMKTIRLAKAGAEWVEE